jgi:hypothetical protein
VATRIIIIDGLAGNTRTLAGLPLPAGSGHFLNFAERSRRGRDIITEVKLVSFGGEAAAMRLLVTGGAGFVGANLIRYVLHTTQSVEVINLDALTYAGNLASLIDVEDDPRYRFVRGDVRDTHDSSDAWWPMSMRWCTVPLSPMSTGRSRGRRRSSTRT